MVADFKREGVRSAGLNLIQKGSDGLQNPEEPLAIRQIQSMSNILINVLVQGKQVEGIVDMASQITINSDKLYNSLPNATVTFSAGPGKKMLFHGIVEYLYLG